MRKKILVLLFIFVCSFSNAQVAVSNFSEFKLKEFDPSLFDRVKNTTTIFVLSDYYTPEEYEKILKESWTFTPFEVVSIADFNFSNYTLGKYSFALLKGASRRMDKTRVAYFFIDFFHLSEKYSKKKKRNIEVYECFARIELIPHATLLSEALMPTGNYAQDKAFNPVGTSYETLNFTFANKRMSEAEEYVSGMVYNENWFHNYSLGMLKNNFQKLNSLLEKKQFYGLSEEEYTDEVKKLKKATLYIPDYLKKEYKTGKSSKLHYDDLTEKELEDLLSDYPYKAEFISEEELDKKILLGEEIYYLKGGFWLGFVQVVNAKTGEVVYRDRKVLSYNIRKKDFKKLAKAIK
ncbi:hypothetical protein NHF50_10300 [Flavobacterium sp. NRK F10]|uniref:YARHG domain-containing protein n=1 Tax=Flavobacterium sediminis TaxID=2201181 RepID=A0A2U8QVK2_9FLAO|nr:MULTISPECIES: hypothetical protein [Flavobacterium]AWM14232.1 hypothetical protein DI487_10460 [Flavobacterium sediminis]MCO6175433.1 hypothetical protein [Flavobacterium sp. NRK F10]